MKKIIVVFLFLKIINVYSQGLSPKYAAICGSPVQIQLFGPYTQVICYDYQTNNQFQVSGTYTVNNPGMYQFTFYNGASVTLVEMVYVYEANPQIIVPNSINTLENYTFKINLNYFPNVPPPNYILSYKWYVDNSLVSSSDSLLYNFYTVRNYNIKCIVNLANCTYTEEINITPLPYPMPISPIDTLVCDTTTIFKIKSYLIGQNVKYVWENISFARTYTTTTNILNTKLPGMYVATLYSSQNELIAISDTARVRWFFAPNILVQATNDFAPNNQIKFNIDVLPLIEGNYSHTFDWDFGDGTIINNTANNYINHTYSSVGTYIVKVSQNTSGCKYRSEIPIVISDNYFRIEPAFSTKNFYTDTVNLQVVTSYDVQNMQNTWNLECYDDFNSSSKYIKTLANNQQLFKAHIPGKYFVNANFSNNINRNDTAYVFFNYRNQSFSFDLKINGKLYEPTLQNYYQQGLLRFAIDFFSTNTQYNANDFFFTWRIDEDIAYVQGKGLTSFEYSLTKTGRYVLYLTVTDPNNVTFEYRFPMIIIPENKEIKLTVEKNNSGNIILDVKQIEQFKINIYNKNVFIRPINKLLMAGNTVVDTIRVDTKPTQISNPNQVTMYIKFAVGGNLNIKLITPQYNVSMTEIQFNPQKITLWGFPNQDIYNLSQSLTQPFYFNSEYVPAQTLDIPYYSSPDNYLVYPRNKTTEQVKTIYSKMQNTDNLVGTNIQGIWRFEISNSPLNSTHGFIEEIGLIFDKKLFQQSVSPLEMTCIDELGREIKLDRDLLIIKDLDMPTYKLNCKSRYERIDTLIEQTLVLNVKGYTNTYYFTPNGDGINDRWLPVAPDSESEIFIINKLGQIVFIIRTTEYPLGWDGNAYGKPVPSDSYWYIVRNRGYTTSKGIINIVR